MTALSRSSSPDEIPFKTDSTEPRPKANGHQVDSKSRARVPDIDNDIHDCITVSHPSSRLPEVKRPASASSQQTTPKGPSSSSSSTSSSASSYSSALSLVSPVRPSTAGHL